MEMYADAHDKSPKYNEQTYQMSILYPLPN